MMEAPTHSAPSMDPAMYGHSRSRTTSSNVFPSQQSSSPSQRHHHHHTQQPQHYQQHLQQQQYQQQHLQQQQQQHSQYTHQYAQQQQQLHPHHQQYAQQHAQQYHHQHSQQQQQQQHHQMQMHSAQQYPQQPHSASNPQLWRRSPSIGAFSTTSSFQQPPPAAYRTSSSDLRRSTSSRSVGTMSHAAAGPGSYVALLRKQKATVWSERAQYEDPRLVAQQRAAKMRANLEVVSSNSGRSQTGLASTNKVSGKIRHGKAPVVGYAPGETHVGVGGVPLRLSAREIDGDGSDDDDAGPMMAARTQHHRAGSSGRSSTGSGRQQQGQHRTSGSGTPARKGSLAGTPERLESLAGPTPHQLVDEPAAPPADDAASGRAQSSRSANSATPSERRDDVVELGQGPRLAINSKLNAALTREKSVKSPEELKRRGSVDERTATLTSGRLFIANPD